MQFVHELEIPHIFNVQKEVGEFAEFRSEWPGEIAKRMEKDSVGQDTDGQGAQKGCRCSRCNSTRCQKIVIFREPEDCHE